MSILESGMDEILAHNERNVTDDLEWAGIASFKFVKSPRTCEGWNDELHWSALDKYFSILNFKPEAYQNAKNASIKDWEKQIASFSGQNSEEIKDYYSRLLQFYFDVSKTTQGVRGNLQTRPVDDEFIDYLKENAVAPWVCSSLPGIDPSSWPQSLPTLIEKLQSLPPLLLWLEPFDLNLELLEKIKLFIQKHSEDPEVVREALKAMLLFAYLSGNGTKLAMAYAELWKYCSTHNTPDSFIEDLSLAVSPHVNLIKKIISHESSIHYAKPGSLMGRFSAAHNSKFQKNQNCWNTSITTDGEYIYLLVSTTGGGKFKIGTGESGTLSGKIYLYKAIDKAEEAAWTFCKGKLYMKSSFRETGVVSIICPNTFKNEGLLQLYCPDLFGNPSKQILNKYYPLLSDGESLFVVGVKLEKIPQKAEEKKEEVKVQEKGEEGKVEVKIDDGKVEVKIENGEVEVKVQNGEVPKLEEEKIKEGNVEEVKIEEVKAGEVKIEEAKIEVAKPEEAKVEEAKVEVVQVEEPKLDEAKVEEVKLEEAKAEEVKIEEIKPEEAKLEEIKAEEVKIEEIKPEEAKLEEIKAEEPKPAEQIEPKPEDLKVEEPKPLNDLLLPLLGPEAAKIEAKPAEKIELIAENNEKIPADQPPIPKEAKKPEAKKVVEKKIVEKKVEKKEPPRKNEKREAPKKEEKKKDDPNLCQFILYKFDVSHLHTDPRPQQKLSELAKELYEGFSCYFSISECQRALAINNDDVEMAATWLVDNGENERGKRIVTCEQSTLLCEATITSYSISNRQKPEVSLKSDTILSLELVSRGEWTITKKHLALHFLNPDGSSATARIFSVDPNDVKLLYTDSHILSNTMNQVSDSKIDGNYWERYGKERVLHSYRGSHIYNRDSDKGFSIENAACYDITNQKFYVTMLNGNFGVHFSVYADQASFAERIMLKDIYLGPQKYEEFVAQGLEIVQECELNRFSLPWKWLRWQSVYSRAILRYTKLLKSSIEDEKIKNLQKIIEKLQARLRKLKIVEEQKLLNSLGITPISILKNKTKKEESVQYLLKEKHKEEGLKQSTEKPLLSVDNSKEAIVTLESSEITLKVLLDLVDIDERIRINAFYLLFLWITHSRPVLSPKILDRFNAALLGAIESTQPELQDLAWKIVNIGWESLCPTEVQEKLWFGRILDYYESMLLTLRRKDSFLYNLSQSPRPAYYYMLYRECTDPLQMWYLKHVSSQCLFISERSYNSLLKENVKVMIDKSSENDLATASIISFLPSDSVSPIAKRNRFTHLLEESWGKFERLLTCSISDPSSNSTHALFEIIIFLCKDSVLDEKNPAEKMAELLNTLLARLCTTMGDRVTTLYTRWLVLLRNLAIECLSFSHEGSANFTQSLIGVLQKIKKLFTIEGKNILQSLCNSFSEGADFSQEKIIETSHPYQRGKQQINETISFPGAIAICIEIDPRSQTDNLHDCLWLSSPDNAGGFNNFNGEAYGSSYKLSGKVSIVNQLVLQGDQIHIEFNAAGQHREESNTSRWGFRIKIKPFYGEPLLFPSDNDNSSLLSKISLRFGGENMVINWISTFNWISFAVSQKLHESFLGGQPQHHPMLTWPIFDSGLFTVKLEDFLINSEQGWIYKESPEIGPLELNVEDLKKSLPISHLNAIQEIFSAENRFSKLVKDMRKLQGYSERYNAERFRPNFKPVDKKFWDNVEAVILYTMLFHTREQKTEDIKISQDSSSFESGYTNDQFKVYGKKINEILNWMVKQVQTSKDKQHAIEDVFELRAKLLAEKQIKVEEKKVNKPVIPKMKKKSNVKRMSLAKPKAKKPEKVVVVKKIELDGKDKEIVAKHFSDRLSGNFDLIKDLCGSFNVVYEEGTKSILDLFEKIWSQNEDAFPNPYQKVANFIYTRLLILLKFNPCCEENTVKSHLEEIEIPVLKRAHTSENSETIEKIAEMRKWVDSYKKWKDWKNPKEDLEENSPLTAIFNFVTAPEIPSNLLAQSREQSIIASKRVVDLQALGDFLQILHLTPGIRMALGLIPQPHLYENIQSCCKKIKVCIHDQSKKILIVLFENLTSIIQKIKSRRDLPKQPPLNLKKESKFLSSQFQYTEIYMNHQLRLIISLLSDIYLLIKAETYCEPVITGLNYEEILLTLTEIFLYCSSFTHSKLAMSVSSGVKLIFSAFLSASQNSSSFDFKEKIQHEIMSTLLHSLSQEIINLDNSIRLEKLLALTFEIVISTGLHKYSDKIQLTKYLSSIILGSSNPVIIRLAARISKILLREIGPSGLTSDLIGGIFEKIGNYAVVHLQPKSLEKKENYVVLLHSPTSEEDVDYLFPVLSIWEELCPNNKSSVNKSEEEASVIEDPLNLEDIYSSDMLGILPIELEGIKNFSVYNRFYQGEQGRGGGRRRGGPRRGKPQSKKPSSKKAANMATSLSKLEKVFDEQNKAFEDVKEADTEEEKSRKTNEKNFISKVKATLKEAQNIANNLLNRGLAQIGDTMNLDQAITLASLIREHQKQLTIDSKSKLPQLPVNPYAKVPQEVSQVEVTKSKKPAQISISENSVYQKIDYLMEVGSSIPSLRSSEKLTGVVIGNYTKPFLHKNVLTGGCISLCIQELLDFLCALMENSLWIEEISSQVSKVFLNINEENPKTLGGLIAYGGWQDIIRPGSSILIESNSTKSKEIVIQGGNLSGFQSCVALVEEDSNYLLKTYQLSELSLANSRLIQKIQLSHNSLAEAIVKINATTEWTQGLKSQLLHIASQVDWNSWLSTDPPCAEQFIKQLLELSGQCPTDKQQADWEAKLIQVWEKLADRDLPWFITYHEEPKSLPSDGFLLSVEEENEGTALTFTLPASSYLTFHPQLSMSNSELTNHKMLKYWEKYIIPRIQEYVKSSFKPIEMDYFFAQLRQPLRIGDVHKASEVANVLCDYRLPSGLVLPDQRHDWSALVIDEVVIGKSCILKLSEKLFQHLENQSLKAIHAQGVTQIPVVIRAIDSRAACLLVEFYDHERLELQMLWLPISSVHPSENHVPMLTQIKDLPILYAEYLNKISAIYAKQILLQSMSGIQKQLLDLIETITVGCWSELKYDRVEGWRFCRPDYISLNRNYTQNALQYYIHHPQETQYLTPKLNWIEEKVIPEKEPSLVEWCVISWHKLCDEMAESARSLDIVEVTTALMGPQVPLPSSPENIVAESTADRKYFPLHYQDSNFCGLVLCFKQDAFLCSNSKLQFFADPEGTELIYEVKAGTQGKGSLSPILFKIGKVWCTHFSFIDIKCSQYNTSFSGPSTLNCRVFGIPEAWTVTTWLTEVVSSALSEKITEDSIMLIQSLEDSICEFLDNSHAPTPVRQILFRLLIRLARRLRYMNSRTQVGMGIRLEWLVALIEEMNLLRDSEFTGAGTLYSSYIQDGVELINTLLLPWDVENNHTNTLQVETPEWIGNNFNSLVFLNYFRHEGKLTPSLLKEANELLQHNQWETVLILENLAETEREKVENILKKHKIRVVSTKNDIIFFDNKCIIFGDGLSTEYFQETNFAEEVKTIEVEEENKESEIWICERCTYENQIDNTICGMCENSKPIVEVKQKIPHIDIRDIENKLFGKKKDAIEELCQCLVTELACTARVVSEEKDSAVLSTALQTRILSSEKKLLPEFTMLFEAVWMELKEVLADEMHQAEEKLLELLQVSGYDLFKKFEEKGVDLWFQKTLSPSVKTLTRKQLECLTDYVESGICHQTRASLYIPPSHIRFPIDNVVSINHAMVFRPSGLSGITIEQIRYNWALIRVFNRYIFDSIGLCNLTQHSLLPRESLTLSVASALSELRALVVFPVKIEVEQHVFALTSVMRESPPKLTLERLKISEGTKKIPQFTKAFELLKDVNPGLLRPPKPQGADPFISFEVIFKGELVVGEAGPYRQFFADISKELQNSLSDLLCPTPNNLAKSGGSTHKYTIRPSGNSLLILQMYEFLGMLMGCCVRTGTRLTLDLTSFFWKPLVGMNLRYDDLEEIDVTVTELLKFVESAPAEMFEESFENFSTKLSDTTIVDVVDNGRNIPVTYENKKDFIKAVLNVRFEESTKQMKALREGLAKVVPIGLLNLITWKQLEEWVCGKPTVDLDLLKKHTKYSGGLTETSPRVLWFWEVLHEFTEEEISKFIKFSWGQERLPSNDEEYSRTHIRLMIKPSMNAEHKDGSLPKADTCFFNLEIPDYSCKEVLRNKLRYAFLTDCESMNADNPLSEQQEAGMYREDHYSGEEE